MMHAIIRKAMAAGRAAADARRPMAEANPYGKRTKSFAAFNAAYRDAERSGPRDPNRGAS